MELTEINSQLRDSDTQKVFDDNAVISKVISSLPQDFNAFTTAWELTSPFDKTLTNLSVGLVNLEAKLKTAATASINITNAFYSSSKQNVSQRSSSSGSNTTVGAHHCSGTSCTHPMHKPQPLSIGTLNRSPPIANTTPLTLKQCQARQQYFDELKKTTTCHNCGKAGHWQGECLELTEAERQELRRQCRIKSPIVVPSSRSFPRLRPFQIPKSHTLDSWPLKISNHLTSHRHSLWKHTQDTTSGMQRAQLPTT